jgi:hypothetical protein
VQISADVPIDRLGDGFTTAKWSNPDAITALAQSGVLIVDDEVQARELLSELAVHTVTQW